MRNLGEYILGGDQEFLVDDQVTFRSRNYKCVEYVPRWLKKVPSDDAEHWEDVTPAAATPAVSPVWTKFHVSLADLKAGAEEGGKVKVKLFTAMAGTIISDAASRPTEVYDAPAEEELPMTSVFMSVGAGGNQEIFHETTGMGTAPADDLGNWVRGANASYQGYLQINLLKEPTDVNAFFSLSQAPFFWTLDLATAALFTSGAVDIWLLISVLP